MQGTVKTLKPGGFGFIELDEGGDDLFFHVRELARGTDESQVVEGVRVSFSTRQGDRGLMAVRVRILAGGHAPVQPGAPSPEECIAGIKQALLAAVEWLDLLEQGLKERR
jgi:cold shock CspA family protein